MWLYLIIFAIPVFAFIKGGALNQNKLFLRVYMIGLALFVGLSDMFGGYDRYIYGEVFDSIADGVTRDASPGAMYAMTIFETGYSYLNYLIAFLTENRYIYILIVTLITYYCIYKAFKRNITNYPLGMILFLGMVFFFSFTYLRQVLAFSIAWWSVRLMIDKKKILFLLCILFVTFLHKSGIIFALVFFVPLRKWDPLGIIITMSVIAAIGASGITGALYDVYVETSNIYGAYNTENSVRIAYVLEVIFFATIILKNYQKIEPTRRNLLFLNMAWMFCALLLLFVRSSDGGRIAWYYTFGIIYTITLICTKSNFKTWFKNRLSIGIISLMLILYIRTFVAWQQYNNLYPYKTFLTDGHRFPDFSWENYEYDHRYDDDKFYRSAFRFLK